MISAATNQQVNIYIYIYSVDLSLYSDSAVARDSRWRVPRSLHCMIDPLPNCTSTQINGSIDSHTLSTEPALCAGAISPGALGCQDWILTCQDGILGCQDWILGCQDRIPELPGPDSGLPGQGQEARYPKMPEASCRHLYVDLLMPQTHWPTDAECSKKRRGEVKTIG